MAAFRRTAILFALFLVLVVIAADLGLVRMIFGWLYDFPYGDKAGHFILFGTLSMLASLGFAITRVRVFFIKPLASSLIIAGLVSLEELSQSLFPNRTADLIDLAASLAGIFLLGELGAWLHLTPHFFP